GEGAGKAIGTAHRRGRDLDYPRHHCPAADRFEREVERIAVCSKAFGGITRLTIGLDPGTPGDTAALDRAVVRAAARDRALAPALDSRHGFGRARAKHANITHRLARVAAQDDPRAVEH